ncbi:sigma-70 family RNA polymerase sigma factor [Sporosarcina sp. A2]|uniref:sigma-70 family RNA polymerase sigma factor n=1 Tax=Sporosarcina sp. A2 TaxID=3393449 RepID=UPI003D7A74C0
MENWADQLLQEYEVGKKALSGMRDGLNRLDPSSAQDLTQINSMIDSMAFSMEWMATGRQPGNYRGADIKSIYQRQYFESMDLIPDIQEQLQDMGAKQLYMTQEEKMILSQIFGEMSLRERQCYILHVGQKMSMGRIAEEMGVSKGTVQGYLKRAEKKVREKVS